MSALHKLPRFCVSVALLVPGIAKLLHPPATQGLKNAFSHLDGFQLASLLLAVAILEVVSGALLLLLHRQRWVWSAALLCSAVVLFGSIALGDQGNCGCAGALVELNDRMRTGYIVVLLALTQLGITLEGNHLGTST